MAAKELPPVEYLRQCFDYDPETGALKWKTRPREHFAANRAWRMFNNRYAMKRAGTVLVRPNGARAYINVNLSGTFYLAHRIIWKMVRGVEPGPLIDHADGDGLSNRLGNLREATKAENAWNFGGYKGLKGAFFHKGAGRWRSQIRVNNRLFHLGLFDTQEEAHAAYCRKAAELHGEFARFE